MTVRWCSGLKPRWARARVLIIALMPPSSVFVVGFRAGGFASFLVVRFCATVR